MKLVPWWRKAADVFSIAVYLWYVGASNIWAIRKFLPYLEKIYAVVSSTDITAS